MLGQASQQARDTLAMAASQAATDAILMPQLDVVPRHGLTGDRLVDTCQLVLRASDIHVDLRARAESTASLDDVGRLTNSANVGMRQVHLIDSRWWQAEGPALLVFLDGQPMALLPVAGGGYRVLDAYADQGHLLDSSLVAKLAPVACQFIPRLSLDALGLGSVVQRCAHGVAAEGWRVPVLGLAAGMCGFLPQLLMGFMVENYLPDAQWEQVNLSALLMLVLVLASGAFSGVSTLALVRVETRITLGLQHALMDRLLHLPVDFFRQYGAAELSERMRGMHEALSALARIVRQQFVVGFMGVGAWIALLVLDSTIALFASAVMAFPFFVMLGLSWRRLQLERARHGLSSALFSSLTQFFQHIATHRQLGAEQRGFALWGLKLAEKKQARMDIMGLQSLAQVLNASFWIIPTCLLLAVVGMTLPELPTGQFLMISAAYGQVVISSMRVWSAVFAAMPWIAQCERLRPILQARPEQPRLHHDPATLRDLQGSLELRQLRFRYDEDSPWLLDDVSIKIRAGEMVAITGASGSGKTTLLRLLTGLVPANSGAIYCDGWDLLDIDLAALRQQMGVLLADEPMMAADLQTNIAGMLPVRREQVWEAARLAGLEQDIRALPMGMHTLIAEGGENLSRSQCQRLLLARAIAHRPRILLIDDALGALDEGMQQQVLVGLKSLGASCILIAHRPLMLMAADRILFLADGKVQEANSYAELMAGNGQFAAMCSPHVDTHV